MIYKRVEYFVKTGGSSPFENWFNRLETPVQAIVARIIQHIKKVKTYWRDYYGK